MAMSECIGFKSAKMIIKTDSSGLAEISLDQRLSMRLIVNVITKIWHHLSLK